MTPEQLRDLLADDICAAGGAVSPGRLRAATIRLVGPRTWVSPAAQLAAGSQDAQALAAVAADRLRDQPGVAHARVVGPGYLEVTLGPPTPEDFTALSDPLPFVRLGGGIAAFGADTGARTPRDTAFRVLHAHARLRARQRVAVAVGIVPASTLAACPLVHDTETALFDALLAGPGALARAVERHDARPWVSYLREFAERIHAWCDSCPSRPVGDDDQSDLHRVRSRLDVVAGLALAHGLALLDVEAPTHL